MVHLFWTRYFWVQAIIINFIYLLALFTVQKLKKSLQQIQNYWECAQWAQNSLFAPNKKFFEKLLISFSSTYYPLSLSKIKKKFPVDLVIRMHYFWAQNGPFPLMKIFSENLLISLASFINAYLHAKNQSKC